MRTKGYLSGDACTVLELDQDPVGLTKYLEILPRSKVLGETIEPKRSEQLVEHSRPSQVEEEKRKDEKCGQISYEKDRERAGKEDLVFALEYEPFHVVNEMQPERLVQEQNP